MIRLAGSKGKAMKRRAQVVGKGQGRESFDSWCRRNRIAPGDPTPAVSSPAWVFGKGYSTEPYSTVFGGASTMPSLATTLEVFCLRTGRTFSVRGSAIRMERYERPRSLLNHYRELIACKRCPDTHVLLSEWQAVSFELIGDPIGAPRITRKERSFGRNRLGNRELFNRKKFPPAESAELERAS